ncbi:hypothetical protein CEXT_388001 [Caerostris extrusa]|uniref:Uncharacterized protein n=1 Tax=Caerostris extrusa TaxID=172846 RepID=A0AAV4WC95_CAEEX|nr:hypothetical protein CEXT_388001 [Caerostris extrusa]
MLLQTGVSLSQFSGSMGNCAAYFQNFPYFLACGEKQWVRLLQQRLEVFHSRSLFFNVFGNDGIKCQFLFKFHETLGTAFNVYLSLQSMIRNLMILLVFY